MQPADDGDLLTDAIVRLESTGLRYMLTGSAAGMFYGLNRATADLDVVIDLDGPLVGVLVVAFEETYLADGEMARRAVNERSMFNFIALYGGLKIDFIVLGSDPLDLEAIERRKRLEWHGTPLSVIAADDLVINKLRWAKASGSARQIEDVRAIMAAEDIEIDGRFRTWIARLGLEEQLEAALQP